jgi:hypothetical protein
MADDKKDGAERESKALNVAEGGLSVYRVAISRE